MSFPSQERSRLETPDVFPAYLHDTVPELTINSLANARRNLNKSRVSATDFIAILQNHKLVRLGKRMQAHLGDL